jgi:hypothetical protein
MLPKTTKFISMQHIIPESFRIGEDFENYVREFLFVPEYYDLLERTHGYEVNAKDFVQSSSSPHSMTK